MTFRISEHTNRVHSEPKSHFKCFHVYKPNNFLVLAARCKVIRGKFFKKGPSIIKRGTHSEMNNASVHNNLSFKFICQNRAYTLKQGLHFRLLNKSSFIRRKIMVWNNSNMRILLAYIGPTHIFRRVTLKNIKSRCTFLLPYNTCRL